MGGCGRTCTVLFANVVPGHTAGTGLLWRFLRALAAGETAAAAWEDLRCTFSPASARRWAGRMRLNQTHVRAVLLRARAPPGPGTKEPLADVVEHLAAAVGKVLSDDPIAAFQARFQTAWPMKAPGAAAGPHSRPPRPAAQAPSAPPTR